MIQFPNHLHSQQRQRHLSFADNAFSIFERQTREKEISNVE